MKVKRFRPGKALLAAVREARGRVRFTASVSIADELRAARESVRRALCGQN